MIDKIRTKIETIMTGSEKTSFFSVGSLLFVLSLCYGCAVRLRERCYKKGILRSKNLSCKIISIGNITVGGTGKTPMTIKVAEIVKRLGYKVAVISRGYKGRAEKTGGIVSNGKTILMGPDKAGDEPFMIASTLKDIPVVVGQNRFEAGCLTIQEFDPDVIVLDDAFQHLRLKRDIDLVLLDCRHPFGNNHLLPRGTLREPVSALSRGDAFIITRSDYAGDTIISTFTNKLRKLTHGKPVFRSYHIPNVYKAAKEKKRSIDRSLQNILPCDPECLKEQKVFAFSGLAGNSDFRLTLENLKCDLIDFLEFPDHHNYSDIELNTIYKTYLESKADFLITTEKDYVRIAHRITWPVDLVVVNIEVSFGDDDEAFNAFIEKRLRG
ncbi:MAG: tetraacyldisaccharide 4'-kinase [Deltaproteobacteria bacterium]|nr:tetraacyldisaccharide 4'-kinase [Deltaproteobacteria bacterium]MBW2663419.1 tetraacyldisaccharide 4'-kinase [Deltaproteobacteria bacterium]